MVDAQIIQKLAYRRYTVTRVSEYAYVTGAKLISFFNIIYQAGFFDLFTFEQIKFINCMACRETPELFISLVDGEYLSMKMRLLR